MTSSFRDPRDFAWIPGLEAAHDAIRRELRALSASDFEASADSLTIVRDGYDETGWLAFELFGVPDDDERGRAARARCPRTADACRAVPDMVGASYSLFRPGTHLYPHRGERTGVLRCHLGLEVPPGDVGLRCEDETRRWQEGRCLVFDDTRPHEAWNRTDRDRVVLIVTFAPRR